MKEKNKIYFGFAASVLNFADLICNIPNSATLYNSMFLYFLPRTVFSKVGTSVS